MPKARNFSDGSAVRKNTQTISHITNAAPRFDSPLIRAKRLNNVNSTGPSGGQSGRDGVQPIRRQDFGRHIRKYDAAINGLVRRKFTYNRDDGRNQ